MGAETIHQEVKEVEGQNLRRNLLIRTIILAVPMRLSSGMAGQGAQQTMWAHRAASHPLITLSLPGAA